jgi:hypothetical protein
LAVQSHANRLLPILLHLNYRKHLMLLIVVSSLVRMLVAACTELSNDEVYYWTYAQYLQWNYFDHPPVIALLIRFFTGNLLMQQEFFIRLGPIVCAAINTWLMYRLGVQVKDERTGWIAACLFTASLYGSILAGLMILPDAPQMVCWLCALLLMLRIIRKGGSARRQQGRLLLLGVVIGLCIMSKVHGVFMWGGLFLYLVLYNRRMLLNPFLYLAVMVTGIIAWPILQWNINNDFVTYSYHEGRVGFFSHIQWDTFFRQLIGEFMYNNPVNMVMIVSAVLALRKTKLLNEGFQQQLLLCVALPLIVVVWFMSLFKDTLPHWTGPAYTTLIPLAAALIVQRTRERVVKSALALPALLLVLLVAGIHWLPFAMGSKDEQHLGAGDLLLDMSGWEGFAQDFDSLYRQDVKAGIMRQGAFMTTDYWFPAAHLDYYVARPGKIRFTAAGSLHGLHHYAWLNKYRPAPIEGQDGYYIAVSNYFDPPPATLLELFQKADPPITINQYRQGRLVRHFFLYRLHHYKGGLPPTGIIP